MSLLELLLLLIALLLSSPRTRRSRTPTRPSSASHMAQSCTVLYRSPIGGAGPAV